MTTTTTTCDPKQVTPCNSGDYAAELTVRKPTAPVQVHGQELYKVEFEITATCNLPIDLFVIRKREARFSAVAFAEEFLYVAMPVDIATVPTDSYDDDLRRRVKKVSLLFTNLSMADEAIESFQERIKKLTNAMKLSDDLGDTDAFIIR